MTVLLAMAAMMVPLVAGVGLWMLGKRPQPAAKPLPTIAEARQALEQGDYERARRIALVWNQSKRLPKAQRFWPPYILGQVAIHEAEPLEGPDKVELYALAAASLKRARAAGFSKENRENGLFLLGKSLFSSGQEAASRPYLEETIDLEGDRRAEAHWLLALVEANEDSADYPQALQHVTAYLADTSLTPMQRDEALLLETRIRFQMNDWTGALAALDRHAKTHRPSEAEFWRGRIQLAQAAALVKDPAAVAQPLPAAAIAKYREALAAFAASQRLDPQAEQAGASSAYLMALCYRAMHDDQAAQAQFERVRKLFPNTPEWAAAAYEAAEYFSRAARNEEALDAYRDYVKAWEAKPTAKNRWLAQSSARTRLSTELQRLISARQFAAVLELTKVCEPLLDMGRRWELLAQTHEAWARRLDQQAAQTPDAEAEPIEREARLHWGLAGDAYRELGKLHYITREYPEFIWDAAQALLAARDYPAAAHEYREYMSLESRNRRPQALLGLAQSLVARGDTREALAILQECIDLDPTSVAAFQAQLLAAEAQFERDEFDKAEACLNENLESDFLTPASQEWRESLFALGRLFYEAGRNDEAITRLEEAVARYPRDPQALEARYMLAESYWKTALATQSVQGGITEAERERRLQDALDDSLGYYDQVLEAFEHRAAESPLPPWQRGMLRNSYFGRGAVLFKLGRYEPAIQAYLAIINRYQGSPEVLDAYVEIFNCYRRLKRTEEATSALQLARVALDHLPEKANFNEATNFTRGEWAAYLDSLATL